MKPSHRLIITSLFTLLQFGVTPSLADPTLGGDRLSEAWQGKHPATREDCRLQHRELEYSYPELFVSIPTSTAEREREAFSGLAQVQGMSYSEFRDLLYGESETRWSGDKGLFNFEASATGSSKSGTRKITFTGVPDTDRGETSPGRKVILNIRVTGDQISLDVTHQKKGFFGWKTVYQGACTNLRKTQTTKPTAYESESSLGEQSQEPTPSDQAAL